MGDRAIRRVASATYRNRPPRDAEEAQVNEGTAVQGDGRKPYVDVAERDGCVGQCLASESDLVHRARSRYGVDGPIPRVSPTLDIHEHRPADAICLQCGDGRCERGVGTRGSDGISAVELCAEAAGKQEER